MLAHFYQACDITKERLTITVKFYLGWHASAIKNSLNTSATCDFSTVGLATKWLRILSLDAIEKIRDHLVANPIEDVRLIFKTGSF